MDLKKMLASVLLMVTGMVAAEESTEESTVNNRQNIEEIVVTGSYIIKDRIDTATGLGLAPRETPQSGMAK